MLFSDRSELQILLIKRDIDIFNMPRSFNDFKFMKIPSYV